MVCVFFFLVQLTRLGIGLRPIVALFAAAGTFGRLLRGGILLLQCTRERLADGLSAEHDNLRQILGHSGRRITLNTRAGFGLTRMRLDADALGLCPTKVCEFGSGKHKINGREEQSKTTLVI